VSDEPTLVLSPRSRELALAALVFLLTLAVRVWGVATWFWMLGDQIRDWSIALRPFAELPLVGPPTHVHGYTVGPAFYWILWAIRVTLGPWFDNLPHAGGIGHALLHSGADALLLAAVWRRTASPWVALTAVVLLATAAFDLCLSALVWNPVMGAILAKVATALVLLDWHRGSAARLAVTAAVAWSAVHAYTGAVFVAAGVFAAMLMGPLFDREWRGAARAAAIATAGVALLQLPYLAHQIMTGFNDSAMAAVTGSVARIAAGADPPEWAKSLRGLLGAVQYIQVAPWQLPLASWVLPAAAVVMGVAYRRDPALLAVTLLPPALALVGYALFLGALDHYYYLPLMPAVVLTVVLAPTAIPSPRVVRIAAAVMLLVSLAAVPARVRLAATIHRLPEYAVLVDASRTLKNRGHELRAIRTAFALPPTCDPEFLFAVLGGRIDRTSPWVGIIRADGHIDYERVAAP
jgi:hypothetical protein